jgi:hypothetical protein
MLVSQSPPMSDTDREFLEGHVNGSQFAKTPHMGDFYQAEAQAAGVSTTGKVYKASLAEYPGDPRAWIGSREDAKKLVEERGWNAEGAVTVRSPKEGAPPPIDLAPDLVEDLAQDALAKDPSLAEKDPGELRHLVKEKHKGHWNK